MPTTSPPETFHQLTIEQVRGLLCCAFEGGSNYWYTLGDYEYPKGTDPVTFAKCDWPRYILLPTLEGGGVQVIDDEGGVKCWLRLADIRDGARALYEDYPKHYVDAVRDEDDAITGDIFLQCCLFGEVIFG